MLGSFAQGGSPAIFAADAAHNLPFMHAFAVLNDVLTQLANECQFSCKSIFLNPLLHASENVLSWENFRLVKEGVDRRNKVAHKGEILPRGQCWKYIDTVHEQLLTWNVLEQA